MIFDKLSKIFPALLLFAAVWGCSSSESDSIVIAGGSTSGNPDTTTVMVYMIGSDLESEGGLANANIKQMIAAQSSDNLKIVLQTGASAINYDDPSTVPQENELTDPLVKNWQNVKRHAIENGTVEETADLGTGCDFQAGITTGCVDMGDGATLGDFVSYSMQNYPADRYILVLWNHGGGSIYGYGGSPASSMHASKLVSALKNSLEPENAKLAIIGFDACLMATAEFAYNLRNMSEYLVASEELEGGQGWDYEPWLSAIAANPQLDTKEIAKIITDSYIAGSGDDMEATLSVINLEKIGEVVAALDELAETARRMFALDKENEWLNIFSARKDAEEFGKEPSGQDYVNNIDIGNFAEALKFYGGAEYAPSADKVALAVKDAVIYSKNNIGHQEATGISLWMPYHFDDPFPVSVLDPYQSVYYSGGYASFSAPYKELLQELIDYTASTSSILDVDMPVVASGEVSVEIISNFGIDDALLLLDMNMSPGEISPAVASVVSAERTAGHNYEAVSDLDGKVLAINGFPTYMLPISKGKMLGNETYVFSVPLYYKDSAADPTEELVTLAVLYDFSNGSSRANDSVTPVDSEGKDDIDLEPGDVLIIPDFVIYDNGTSVITPSADYIVLGQDGSDSLTVTRESVNADFFTFHIKNMKGEQDTSEFFDINGTVQNTNAASKDALLNSIDSPLGSYVP